MNSAAGSPNYWVIALSGVMSYKHKNPPPNSEFDGGSFNERHRRIGDTHRPSSQVAFSANRSCGVKPGGLSSKRGRCAPRSGETKQEVDYA